MAAINIDAGSIIKPVADLIDGLFTSDEERAAAKLALVSQQGQQRLAEAAQQMSAIMAEAQSADPWTSRARPSFLYVVYALLLWSIPMGALTIFSPDAAAQFTTGFKAWLSAIPEPILSLFGVVMTGYVAGRSWEKVKGVAK